MAENKPVNSRPESDEVDLGQLFRMIGRGFDRVFKAFLRVFLYVKRKAVWLVGAIIIGLAIGFLLNEYVDKQLKTEVIVKPNFESKDYLYDIIEEIQANIVAKDTQFLDKLGLDMAEVKGFGVSIEPIEKKNEDQEKIKEQNTYLEILQNFKDQEFISEVIRSEILDKTVLTHRITFLHKNPFNGQQVVGKIMDYINANPYFLDMRAVYVKNAEDRIVRNKELIAQIDGLVQNYSEKLGQPDSSGTRPGGTLSLNAEESFDITGLLGLKNALVKQMGDKQIELVQQKDPINIISFGKTQEVKNQFLNKSLLLSPLIVIGLFFLWGLLKYLNRKASDLQV